MTTTADIKNMRFTQSSLGAVRALSWGPNNNQDSNSELATQFYALLDPQGDIFRVNNIKHMVPIATGLLISPGRCFTVLSVTGHTGNFTEYPELSFRVHTKAVYSLK